MNYEYVWKVLERIIMELKNRNVTIPQELIFDLKSAQTLIKLYNAEPKAVDIAAEAETYLEKVESNLLYLAGSDIGEKYAEECLKRLKEARIKGLREKARARSRFILGVPKGDHWIRIKSSDLISEEDLNKLLEKHHLSSKPQEDGFLLIHGEESRIKEFIRKITEKVKR